MMHCEFGNVNPGLSKIIAGLVRPGMIFSREAEEYFYIVPEVFL